MLLPFLSILAFAGPDLILTVEGAGVPQLPGCALAPLAPARGVWRAQCVSPPGSQVLASHGVRRATPDVDLELQWDFEPDDLERAWWLYNEGQIVGGRAGVPGADVGAIEAWSLWIDATTAPIAVLDSGTRLDHEDLADNLWVNRAEADGEPGVDDDGNGWIDDIHGWGVDGAHDPSTGCNNPHGTLVAGVAGAVGDNGVGFLGLAPRAALMPIRIIGSDCRATAAGLIGALEYARQQGAAVVNFSAHYAVSVPELEEAWRTLSDADVVLVLSAGNDGALKAEDSAPYPLRHALPTAVGVAATDNTDAVWRSTAYGPELVHLAAPGVSVGGPLSSSPTAYAPGVSGTSLSAPLVSAAVAVIRARWPTLRADQVIDALRAGVAPLEALDCGLAERCVAWGGRLDAGAAMSYADAAYGGPKLLLNMDDASGEAAPGERVAFGYVLLNKGHDPAEGLIFNIPAGAAVDPAPAVMLGAHSQVEGSLAVSVPDECDEDYELTVSLSVQAARHEGVTAEAGVRVLCPEPSEPEDTGDTGDSSGTDEPEDTDSGDLGSDGEVDGAAPSVACACSAASGGTRGALLLLGLFGFALVRRRLAGARDEPRTTP